MEASCYYLKLWKTAFEEYNIALHRGQLLGRTIQGGYYAQVLNGNQKHTRKVLPSMVIEYAKLDRIWCIPEIRTHEECVAVLKHDPGRGRQKITSLELTTLMDKWFATFYDLGDRNVEHKNILPKVRGYMEKSHEDEGRSMETCEDVIKWMTAFVYVFELKDGLLRDMISEKIQIIYRGMSNAGLEGGYSKKIFGCSCSMWMRYCVCVHSWAHMIMWKVL